MRRRHRPALVIVVPFEGRACVYLDARTFGDERALRLWLRRTRVLDELRGRVLELLDIIDEQEST